MRRLFQRKNAGENGSGKSAGGLPLGWPALLMLALALGCAVIWAFIMGFMVGRGHNPEAHLREMTGFPAKTQAEAAPAEIPPAEAATLEKPESGAETTESTPILFPEPSGDALGAWEKEAPKKDAPKKDVRKKETPQKNTAQTAQKQDKNKEREVKYDFSYQLAAFRSSQDAENLKKKARYPASRVEVRKSGKVYLVVASFRGTDKTAQDFVAKMRPIAKSKPLQLSRREIVSARPQKTGNKK